MLAGEETLKRKDVAELHAVADVNELFKARPPSPQRPRLSPPHFSADAPLIQVSQKLRSLTALRFLKALGSACLRRFQAQTRGLAPL